MQALKRNSSSLISSSSDAVMALQASDITVVYCRFDHCK